MTYKDAKKIRVGDPVWVSSHSIGVNPEVMLVLAIGSVKYDNPFLSGKISSTRIIFKVGNNKCESKYIDHLDIANASIYGTPVFDICRNLFKSPALD